MPVMELVYSTEAERWGETPGHLRDDQMYIILKFMKGTARRHSPADPFTYDFRQMDAQRGLSVPFDGIKQKRYRSQYAEQIRSDLSRMGVPELYHSETLEPLFAQVDAAVSRDPPILVGIYEIDCYTETDYTPAARSAVEGLERVRLDRAIMEDTQSCAICWVDYVEQDVVDQLMLTRMPCSHYFHGDCIRQWLQVNHLCPMCRYSMPVEQQQQEPLEQQQEPVDQQEQEGDCTASLQLPSKEGQSGSLYNIVQHDIAHSNDDHIFVAELDFLPIVDACSC